MVTRAMASSVSFEVDGVFYSMDPIILFAAEDALGRGRTNKEYLAWMLNEGGLGVFPGKTERSKIVDLGQSGADYIRNIL